MNSKETIMYDSDKAAVYESRTLTGWWTQKDTRTGKAMFWGEDEHMARWSGSTHKVCECGNVHTKSYTCCDECRHDNEEKRYRKLLIKGWDGKTPLCIYNEDTWFFDEDEIRDYCEENSVASEDLMLVICEPVHAQHIDAYDQWCDDLPEDGELPDDIIDAVKELNEVLKAQPPLCWRQGNRRTTVSV